ncbi:MAG TPA: hypothetical protein VGG92_13540 [Caulobacteraceae bacterium]|jgi:hypothetical protein
MQNSANHDAAIPLAIVPDRTESCSDRPAIATFGAAAIIAAAAYDDRSHGGTLTVVRIDQICGSVFASDLPEPAGWALTTLGMGGARVVLRRRWGAALA